MPLPLRPRRAPIAIVSALAVLVVITTGLVAAGLARATTGDLYARAPPEPGGAPSYAVS